jgi:nitroimidazol reductase NimA-like FMN-containing flavoprotein (pyridoxamine 5'-phosphate oxidase superfamily)
MTEPEREAFLAEPRVAVLSVAGDGDRPPLTVPIWYHYQPGGNVTFFTGTQGRKARKIGLIERAGVVSLCVQQPQQPYRYVTVEGAVIDADRPPAAAQALAIARRYLPEEFAQGFVAAELERPASEWVLFTVRPERWLSLDFAADTAAGR